MRGRVYLIGMGPGGREALTAEAVEAIGECELLMGSARLVEQYMESGKELSPVTAPAEIVEKLGQMPENTVSGVLLSGDVGFYSGARGLYAALEDYEVLSIPGVSSLSYFCARISTAWQDVHVLNANTRACDWVGAVRAHGKTFLLVGGENRVQDICWDLAEHGLGELAVWVGENLSYASERITYGTAAELSRKSFDTLCVMLVANPAPLRWGVAVPGIRDEDFLQKQPPRLSEEVRTLALSKLHLYAHHILWDVGAGMGAAAVQGALAVPEGQVYAVEQEPVDLEVMAQNKARFAAMNLKLVAGEAPEALRPLPAPDRVLIEESEGNLSEMLGIIFDKNPAARVAVCASTLEALSEAGALFTGMGLEGVEMLQVAVSRAEERSGRRAFTAGDPVWLLVGEGQGQ